MKTLRRALRYMRPYWGAQLLAIVCALAGTVLDLVQPWLFKMLIDDVFVHRSYSALRFVCLAFLGSLLLSAAFRVARGYLFTWLGERTLVDIRNDLFRHLQGLPLSFFTGQQSGRTLSIFTNDVGAMQVLYTSTLADLITNSLQMVVVLGVLFRLHAGLAVLSLPVLPLFGLAIILFSGPLREAGRRIQEKAAEVSGGVQEAVAGAREIKSFTQEERQEARFAGMFRSVLVLRLRQTLLGAESGALTQIAAWGGILWVIWRGGHLVLNGELSAGTLIAFTTYLGSLFGPTSWFVNLNVSFQGALAGAERVFQFLDIAPAVTDPPDARPLPHVRGEVRFENVSFAYEEGAEVLSDISLQAEPGEVIALVGPSGSGKTTLVHLLARFHDPTAGRVTVDGHDLRHVQQRSLREQIGMVFQETFLFTGTIEEAILFGRPDASHEEVMEAAIAANAHDFILALPDGYQTQVGERGVKLSGGQRQRIAIARAVLRNPRLLILDEATSALDSESEAAVQDALARLVAGRTTFVIAHRLSTIQHADRVVVLEAGRIVEVGCHAELLAQGGAYRRLHLAQALGVKG